MSAFAQNEITLDLSKRVSSILPIEPQTVKKINIINGLATLGTVYTVSIEVIRGSPSVLSLPNNGGGSLGGTGMTSCAALDAAITKLEQDSDESQIPPDIADLQSEIEKASATTCGLDIKQAGVVISRTTAPYSFPVLLTINKGDKLKIVITRADKSWAFIYENRQPSHWTTYYGFTYIPDVFTKFMNYYANQQGDGTYMISAMNSSNKNVFQNVSPTAMFTYRFFKKKPDAFAKFGLTVGLFYNTEVLGAMSGPSVVIGDAATLNTGISFVQKYQLKGQYKGGEVIQDNLDFDQLHNKIWSYDMFISIGINIPELFGKTGKKNSTTDAGSPSGN
jgi:hypothetical protein